eukprot:492326-Rhodomonas_salina.2
MQRGVSHTLPCTWVLSRIVSAASVPNRTPGSSIPHFRTARPYQRHDCGESSTSKYRGARYCTCERNNSFDSASPAHRSAGLVPGRPLSVPDITCRKLQHSSANR